MKSETITVAATGPTYDSVVGVLHVSRSDDMDYHIHLIIERSDC